MAMTSSFAAWFILLGTNFVPLTLTDLLRIFAFSRRRLAILLRAGKRDVSFHFANGEVHLWTFHK